MNMYVKSPIVVVDDDVDDHYLFKAACESLKISNPVKFFKDARGALDYLTTTTDQPFVILCDINMPMTNGIEFRRSIASNDYLRKKSIPFIFFSTASTPAQVEEAYELTVQGFFLKGNSFEETKKDLDMIFKYWSRCKHPNTFE